MTTDITELTQESARESGSILIIVAARMARREFFTPLHALCESGKRVVSTRALCDAVERAEERMVSQVSKIVDGHDRLTKKLKEAESRNAELVEALEKAQCAGSINNQWKPDVCPITGRRFFLWIEHPEFGYVPTYGSPYDSYTIPTRDSDGEFSCERYDHDFGGWVDGECVGAYLIDDDEQSRVYELEQRIADLESRTITFKLPFTPEPIAFAPWVAKAFYQFHKDTVKSCVAVFSDACQAAGIKMEAE